MGVIHFLVKILVKTNELLISWLVPEPVLPSWPLARDQVEMMQCAGANVRVDPSVRLDCPFGLSIANNVLIGADTYIDAQAGVIVCDGVEISDSVSILSSLPLPEHSRDPELPDERLWSEVFIGPDAKIGAHVCILPGVSIGEGAEIAPGTIVDRDVPAHARLGFPAFGNEGLSPVKIAGPEASAFPVTDPTAGRPVTGRERRPNISFIVTTGRAGSSTIVDVLNRHEQIVAKHEPRHQLIKLSTDYAYGLVSTEQALEAIERLYLDGSVYHPDRHYVESDQKLFNLIPLLRQVLPDARFVWLIRDGRKVVASTYARSWFADSSHPVWRQVMWFYHRYRVAGDLSGAVPGGDWAGMSAFERNCWYWAYVNETIEQAFEDVPPDRKMMVRLEELKDSVPELLSFMGVEKTDLPVQVKNEAFYAKTDAEAWAPEQVAAFNRFCSPLMERIYG